jgi:hypothetical protein
MLAGGGRHEMGDGKGCDQAFSEEIAPVFDCLERSVDFGAKSPPDSRESNDAMIEVTADPEMRMVCA